MQSLSLACDTTIGTPVPLKPFKCFKNLLSGYALEDFLRRMWMKQSFRCFLRYHHKTCECYAACNYLLFIKQCLNGLGVKTFSQISVNLDARCGWKLESKLFLTRVWSKHRIFTVLGYSVVGDTVIIFLYFSLQIDAPLSPGAKGSDTFLRGITDDVKQQYRNYLFDVNKDQLKAATER